jgi:hypothetical protein
MIRTTCVVSMCVVAMLTWASGCLGTETGNPPAVPVVDVSRIGLTELPAAVEISGMTGAIEPGGGTVRLLNLDGVAGFVVAEVAADGSFVGTVEGTTADVFRLHAKLGDLRAPPIDFQIVGLPIPAVDCIEVTPDALDADHGTVGIGETGVVSVSLRNGCSTELTVTSLRMRLADPAFVITAPAPPWSIPVGESASVDVTFSPTSPGEAEEVLLIDVQAGASDARFAISMYGRGAP